MKQLSPSTTRPQRGYARRAALLLGLSGLASAVFGQTFAPASVYSTGVHVPHNVALGDVNTDGHLDIVTTNQGSNTVGVLLGQAGGTFAAATAYASGGSDPSGVALGDVNADGRPDLVTGHSSSSTVGVLLNQGNPLAAAPAVGATAVALYPNPAHAGFTVEVSAVAGATQLHAVLLNPLGQVVRRRTTALPAIGTRLAVETSGLAAGVYTLQLRAGTATVTKRVVIY